MKKTLLFTVAILLTFAKPEARPTANRLHFGNLQQLTPPHFPGGSAALNNYIFSQLDWPKVSGEIQPGSLVISFYVEKDGTLTGFNIEKSFSPAVDAAVLKLLKNSPKWIPALQNNKPIRSHYTLPIRYHTESREITAKDSVLKG